MRDGGRADEITKWGCVSIEQNRAENGALGTPHIREDEREREVRWDGDSRYARR